MAATEEHKRVVRRLFDGVDLPWSVAFGLSLQRFRGSTPLHLHLTLGPDPNPLISSVTDHDDYVYANGHGTTKSGLLGRLSDENAEGLLTKLNGEIVVLEDGLHVDGAYTTLTEPLRDQQYTVTSTSDRTQRTTDFSLLALDTPEYGVFDQYEALLEQLQPSSKGLQPFDGVLFWMDFDEQYQEDYQKGAMVTNDELEARLEKSTKVTPTWTSTAEDVLTGIHAQIEDSPDTQYFRSMNLSKLAIAAARLRGSDVVALDDVLAVTDAFLGRFDLKESCSRKCEFLSENLSRLLKQLSEENRDEGVHIDEIFERGKEDYEILEPKVREELRKMQRRGDVIEPGIDHYLYISNSS